MLAAVGAALGGLAAFVAALDGWPVLWVLLSVLGLQLLAAVGATLGAALDGQPVLSVVPLVVSCRHTRDARVALVRLEGVLLHP